MSEELINLARGMVEKIKSDQDREKNDVHRDHEIEIVSDLTVLILLFGIGNSVVIHSFLLNVTRFMLHDFGAFFNA